MNAYQVAILIAGAALVLLVVLVARTLPALRRFLRAAGQLSATTARHTAS